MKTIHELDNSLINKIAAGEVIERPASVVKELIENSIDAGADEIKIEISEAGKKKIKITDNGSGMSEEDALLHADNPNDLKLRFKGVSTASIRVDR